MKILSEKQLRNSIRSQLSKMAQEANSLLNEEKPKETKVPDSELAGSLRKNAKQIASTIPSKYNDNFARLLQSLVVMAEHDPASFNRIEKMILKYDDKAVVEDEKEGGDKEAKVADGSDKKKSDYKWQS